MPRTIFQTQSVNKPYNLANTKSNMRSVCIGGNRVNYKQSIDRIQLSVCFHCWDFICQSFDNIFKFKKTVMVDDKYIRQYIADENSVELVKHPYTTPYSTVWISIGIQDPTAEVLKVIMTIIDEYIVANNLSRNSVSLTQAEFAFDFYPHDTTKFDELCNILKNSVVLKHARTSSHKQFKSTTYVGKNGNVRKGSKGLRCYPKVINKQEVYRIELNANRLFLRYKSINTKNIFEFADKIKQQDCFNLYQSVSENEVDQIAKRIIQKKHINSPVAPRSLKRKAALRAFGNYIADGILDRDCTVQVSTQMDRMKEIHSEFRLSYHKDRIFSKLKIEQT